MQASVFLTITTWCVFWQDVNLIVDKCIWSSLGSELNFRWTWMSAQAREDVYGKEEDPEGQGCGANWVWGHSCPG